MTCPINVSIILEYSSIMETFILVGAPRIEPGLPAPSPAQLLSCRSAEIRTRTKTSQTSRAAVTLHSDIKVGRARSRRTTGILLSGISNGARTSRLPRRKPIVFLRGAAVILLRRSFGGQALRPVSSNYRSFLVASTPLRSWSERDPAKEKASC